MSEYVEMRREFPWLGRGFIYAVSNEHIDEFVESLGHLGFRVGFMRPASPADFPDALGQALNFPQPFGGGWDALNDLFRDVELGEHFALIWRNAATIAASDPKLFGEATSMLVSEFHDLRGRGTQAELVITGEGPAFRRPPPVDTPGGREYAQRRRDREYLHDLGARVNEWDPLGLLALGAPHTEYDALVAPINRGLRMDMSPKQLAVVLDRFIRNTFGAEATGTFEFAVATIAWYRTLDRQRGTDSKGL
jgi:hypothetical protein